MSNHQFFLKKIVEFILKFDKKLQYLKEQVFIKVLVVIRKNDEKVFQGTSPS